MRSCHKPKFSILCLWIVWTKLQYAGVAECILCCIILVVLDSKYVFSVELFPRIIVLFLGVGDFRSRKKSLCICSSFLNYTFWWSPFHLWKWLGTCAKQTFFYWLCNKNSCCYFICACQHWWRHKKVTCHVITSIDLRFIRIYNLIHWTSRHPTRILLLHFSCASG